MFPGGRPQNMQPSGGQFPMVQYPGMYYCASTSVPAPAWSSTSNKQADAGRGLLAESYERMRNEMRSLQGGMKPDAPPPPSMDSSKDNAAIKMLLNNENVSLSSLLEAAMDPSAGSNKGTEDPFLKKTVLDKCEGKIAQLYRHRISGMGTFFPNVPPKGTKANSSCFLTFHHPRIEFNMKGISSVWNCSEVNVDAVKRKKKVEAAVEEKSVKPKKADSPALEAAEVYANKPNPLMPTNLFGYGEAEKLTEPPPGQIPVIIQSKKDVPVVDLTGPPPTIESYPEPPPDPYATTAFELWAEIERERRHKEKLKEWEMLNEKHKERDREKEERKKKKKKHRHSRSASRSRSRSRRRSRGRHREKRRWRSRSRRRTRSISLSPSPSRKRSRSPRSIERRRLSRSPQRRSSPSHQLRSSEPLSSSLMSPQKFSSEPYSQLHPGPPGDEWSASSAWPQSARNVPPISEYYDPYSGTHVYSEGGDYYGNNGPYPPYNMPRSHYGVRPLFPPRGYPMGGRPGAPHMWGPRGPPYGYRPPPLMDAVPGRLLEPGASAVKGPKLIIKRTFVKQAPSNQNLVEVTPTPVVNEQGNNSADRKSKPESKRSPHETPTVHSSQKQIEDVIILDDDGSTITEPVPKASSTSIDHPPGVSPDREPSQATSDKQSHFTKPMREKFRELLKPFEKILDVLKIRQRESFDYKTLIKGLEIGSCEFDGVYTLVEGILCRVVIDAMERAKTCFKIVLSSEHVTSVLMEIHKMYHDYSYSKIKRTIEDLFYDTKQFPTWKIVNVIKICKQCQAEARRKMEAVQQRSSERDESDGVDRESHSKSKSRRRRSESKDRDDRKKGRHVNKEDRDRPEKTELKRSRKQELQDITLKGGDVLVNVITETSKVEDSAKQTIGGAEEVIDSSGDKNELATNEFLTSDASESDTGKTREVVKSKDSCGEPEVGKSARSNANPKELFNVSAKEKGMSASEKHDKNSGSPPLSHDTTESQKPEGEKVEPIKPSTKPGLGKSNKPVDFKLRVRSAQLSVDELKTLITSLEGSDKNNADPNYLLKAGMLCKRVSTNDGKTEVKIAVTPQSLLKMIQIVHTMAATHAPLEKTITVFNKHFTSIRGVQEAVTIVLNNCEVCKAL